MPHIEPNGHIVIAEGLTIIAYRSPMEPDKRWVIEIETDEGGEVAHENDIPCLKIMLNECVLSNDYGDEKVNAPPQQRR